MTRQIIANRWVRDRTTSVTSAESTPAIVTSGPPSGFTLHPCADASAVRIRSFGIGAHNDNNVIEIWASDRVAPGTAGTTDLYLNNPLVSVSFDLANVVGVGSSTVIGPTARPSDGATLTTIASVALLVMGTSSVDYDAETSDDWGEVAFPLLGTENIFCVYVTINSTDANTLVKMIHRP